MARDHRNQTNYNVSFYLMHSTKSDRGFISICESPYNSKMTDPTRIISESSIIGDYGDSWDKPGSSFLWVGNEHHLNREQVATLISQMQHWLDTGRLPWTNKD